MAYKWWLLTTYIHWDDPPSIHHSSMAFFNKKFYHSLVNEPSTKVKKKPFEKTPRSADQLSKKQSEPNKGGVLYRHSPAHNVRGDVQESPFY